MVMVMPKDDGYVEELDGFLSRLSDTNTKISPEELGFMSFRISTMLDNAITPGVRESLNNSIQGNKAAITRLDGLMTDADREAGYSNPSDELLKKTAPKAGKRWPFS